jgi:hypothetical protein
MLIEHKKEGSAIVTVFVAEVIDAFDGLFQN